MNRSVLVVVAILAVGVAPQAEQKPRMIRFSPTGPAGFGMAAGEASTVHLYYESKDNGGSSAGIWEARPFTKQYHNYTYAQFIYLLDGSLTLIDKNDSRQETFRAGDAVLVPRGAAFTWNQTEKVRTYFVIFDRETPASGEIPEGAKPTFVQLKANGPAGVGLKAGPNGGPAKSYKWYGAAHRSIVGSWTTAPVNQPYTDTRFAQLMLILRGTVTFRMPDGTTEIVKPGEAILMPRGMEYSWESQDVNKFYIVFDQVPMPAGADKPPVS